MGGLGPLTQEVTCRALLFDLDGVLIDSTPDFHRHWIAWAAAHGLDGEATFEVGQGIRTADHIRLVAPHLDPDLEARRFEEMEVEDVGETVALPGARNLVAQVPPNRWAVVTSSIRSLARARLRAGGVPLPKVLVCADDVTNGKPDPEGYVRACSELGVPANTTVVFEDSPAGVAAGRAAGAFVIAVPTTHTHEQLAGADAVTPLVAIGVRVSEGGVIALQIAP